MNTPNFTPQSVVNMLEGEREQELARMTTAALFNEALPGVPLWAIRALREVLMSALTDSKTIPTELTPRLVGRMTALGFQARADDYRDQPQIAALMQAGFAKQAAAQMMNDCDNNERRDFCEGYASVDSETRAQPSSPRAGCYILIALGWRAVAKMKNSGELQQWLEARLGKDCVGDERRVRDLCAKIGLRLAKRGRPSKRRVNGGHVGAPPVIFPHAPVSVLGHGEN